MLCCLRSGITKEVFWMSTGKSSAMLIPSSDDVSSPLSLE